MARTDARLGELPAEIEAMRRRHSRLSRASLRITDDLDPGDVLRQIADEARALTAARYAVITVRGESGQVEDYTAAGLDGEEAQRLWTMPEARRFFEHLDGFAEPLRVADFAAHARSSGLPAFRPPMPMSALLSAPIRQRGVGAGYIYVARSEPGQTFNREDEETLVMFAAQAALVIANARRRRGERPDAAQVREHGRRLPHRTVRRRWRSHDPFGAVALYAGIARAVRRPHPDRRPVALLPQSRRLRGDLVRAQRNRGRTPASLSRVCLMDSDLRRPAGE